MAQDQENVVEAYERHAVAWMLARALEAHLYERKWMEQFTASIAPGASVLDIGCGSGEPLASYLSQAGFAITGVDASLKMVAAFRRKLPGQEAFVADMRGLNIDRKFAGLLAWDSFFHLNREDQRGMFAVFEAHAAPEAALMFTTGAANGEAVGTLGSSPLYHASLAPAEYHELLRRHGFRVVDNILEDASCKGRSVWLAQRI